MPFARLSAPFTALVLLAGTMADARANLLSNGGFETPTLTSGYAVYDHGGAIGGWTVFGTGNPSAAVLALHTSYLEYGDTLAFSAKQGVVSLDLTGSGNQGQNGVTQTVATSAGAPYTLSFWVGNQDAAFDSYPQDSAIEVFVNGLSAGVFTNADNTPADVSWKQFSIGFTAAGATTSIAFVNMTPPGDNMAGLDDIVLVEVPEPATMAVLSLALTGMMGLGRRR